MAGPGYGLNPLKVSGYCFFFKQCTVLAINNENRMLYKPYIADRVKPKFDGDLT